MKVNLRSKLTMSLAALFSASALFAQVQMVQEPLQNSKLDLRKEVQSEMRVYPQSALYKQNGLNSVVNAPAADFSVKYAKPKGVYNIADAVLTKPVTGIFVPVQTELTYVNQSTGATSFTWEYFLNEKGKVQESSAKDLTINIPYPIIGGVQSATLTGTDGSATGDFYYGEYTLAGGQIPVYNLDPDSDLYYYAMEGGGYMFGTNAEYQYESILEIYEAPAAPVLLAGIIASCYTDKDYPNVNVDLSVLEITKDNKIDIDNPMIKKTTKLGKGHMVVEFEKPILVNTAYAIAISIPYSKDVQWALLTQELPKKGVEPTKFTTALVPSKTGSQLEAGGIYPQPTSAVLLPILINPFIYNLQAEGSDYFYMDDTMELDATVQGKYRMDLTSFTPLKSVDSNASWLAVSNLELIDEKDGIYAYNLDIAGLPDGMSGQSAVVTVTDEFGFSKKFKYIQGTVGIGSVTAPDVKVIYENGQLGLTYDAAIYNAIEVYSVAGSKLFETTLNGQTSLPVLLNQGLYVVKLNGSNANTVKVLVK